MDRHAEHDSAAGHAVQRDAIHSPAAAAWPPPSTKPAEPDSAATANASE